MTIVGLVPPVYHEGDLLVDGGCSSQCCSIIYVSVEKGLEEWLSSIFLRDPEKSARTTSYGRKCGRQSLMHVWKHMLSMYKVCKSGIHIVIDCMQVPEQHPSGCDEGSGS